MELQYLYNSPENRIDHHEEWIEIDEIIEKMGWSPIPGNSVVIYAYDKGIAGFHVLQPRPHAEPLWVRGDMRGTGLAADLAGAMESFLRETNTEGFMCIADSPEAEKLCKSFGMRKIHNPVYIR